RRGVDRRLVDRPLQVALAEAGRGDRPADAQVAAAAPGRVAAEADVGAFHSVDVDADAAAIVGADDVVGRVGGDADRAGRLTSGYVAVAGFAGDDEVGPIA